MDSIENNARNKKAKFNVSTDVKLVTSSTLFMCSLHACQSQTSLRSRKSSPFEQQLYINIFFRIFEYLNINFRSFLEK